MTVAMAWGVFLAALVAGAFIFATWLYRRGFSEGQANARYRLESREQDMRDRHAGDMAAIKQEYRDRLDSLGRLLEDWITKNKARE